LRARTLSLHLPFFVLRAAGAGACEQASATRSSVHGVRARGTRGTRAGRRRLVAVDSARVVPIRCTTHTRMPAGAATRVIINAKLHLSARPQRRARPLSLLRCNTRVVSARAPTHGSKASAARGASGRARAARLLALERPLVGVRMLHVHGALRGVAEGDTAAGLLRRRHNTHVLLRGRATSGGRSAALPRGEARAASSAGTVRERPCSAACAAPPA
jgi:hypothetical protein